eukprot:TRINITY_DN27818_c0_g1_i1.p1 TRINITY_DN27818_c0_g1~~TRINITY_DN27818_c0_g1_i1.p1  ORF type:complete len:433 (-),score=121.95 TRINITY_DN27818_c0_g1_i1:86-1324(-)
MSSPAFSFLRRSAFRPLQTCRRAKPLESVRSYTHDATLSREFDEILRSEVVRQRPPRRALLYVPGSDARKIAKSSMLGADVVILDLEDGVASSAKLEARANVIQALTNVDFGHSEVLVRINAVGSGIEMDDLREILTRCVPSGIVLPKVEDRSQISSICEMLAEFEQRPPPQRRWRHWPSVPWRQAAEADGNTTRPGRGVGDDATSDLDESPTTGPYELFAMIETARGVHNLGEIATSNPRLTGLLFGAEDYACSVGGKHFAANAQVAWARSLVLNCAAAHNLQAFDMIQTQWRDLDAIRRDAAEAAAMGFTGKQAIHPDQIGPIHDAFRASDDEVKAAYKVLEAFASNQATGTGAFQNAGRLVELPHARAAAQLLGRVFLIYDRERAAALAAGRPLPFELQDDNAYRDSRR